MNICCNNIKICIGIYVPSFVGRFKKTTTSLMLAIKCSGVTCAQPLHKLSNPILSSLFKKHMKVVRHTGVRMNIHYMFSCVVVMFTSSSKIQEKSVVLMIAKSFSSVDTPIINVIILTSTQSKIPHMMFCGQIKFPRPLRWGDDSILFHYRLFVKRRLKRN